MSDRNFVKGDVVQAKKEYLADYETQVDTMGIVIEYDPFNDRLDVGCLEPEKYALPPIFLTRGEYYEKVESK